MEAPDKKDEHELVLRRLVEGLRYAFPKATISLDEGERDPQYRPFEKFEVFYMLPEGCLVLDGRDIDSVLVFEMLIFQAVRAIENRYRQMLPSLPSPIRGIGIHQETHWRFGDDVPEGEAMLGDPEEDGDIPACWTFWARYVLPINQKVTRCKSAPIHLPPELPERAGTQWVVTEEGLIREVVPTPPERRSDLVWDNLPVDDEKDKPRFYPVDERYGYEDEEEPDEEGYER